MRAVVTRVTSASVEIDGAGEGRHNEYGRIDFYNGRFLLKNVAPWFTSEQDGLAKFDVAVRSTSSKSRVTFGPGVSMGQELVRKTEAFDLVYSNGSCGTLELLDGCAFTNRLIAAYNANQSAAVYQRGGDVYLTNGGSKRATGRAIARRSRSRRAARASSTSRPASSRRSAPKTGRSPSATRTTGRRGADSAW